MRVDATTAMPRVFAQGPYKLAMGLKRLDPASWLMVSEHYDAEIAEKRRLLADGADIVRALPEAAPAVAETLALIEAFLHAHHPHLLPGAADTEPLRRAGLLVQEDLCWLLPSAAGHRLVAAFVAFPARWRLADKIGQPMAAIHGPVPDANARLGGPIERLFATLAVDRPLWRANWSILDDPDLHQPEPKARHRPIDAAGGALFVRVERQTLRRLPATGAVLFTIHSFVQPLAEVAADPEAARALADRLDEMPAAMRAYKNLETLRPAVQRCLRERAAT